MVRRGSGVRVPASASMEARSGEHADVIVMGPGDGHTVDNDARTLFMFTPGSPGMERFFERSAQLPEDARMADAFSTLAMDAGMMVVGPPLAQSRPGP